MWFFQETEHILIEEFRESKDDTSPTPPLIYEQPCTWLRQTNEWSATRFVLNVNYTPHIERSYVAKQLDSICISTF